MVEQLSSSASARLVRQGIKPMRLERALESLGRAIHSGAARVAIADMDWAAFGGQYPAGSAAREFLEGFLPHGPVKLADAGSAKASVAKTQGSDGRDEIAAIVAAAKSERGSRMESFVRAAARKVLGLSVGRPMPAETPMQEFGLDSLMALELRNVLAQAMGRPLSATLLFDYPSIRGLAAFLLELVVPAEVVPVKAVGPVDEIADEELAGMSDAEAEELLLAELNRNGSGL
jgi:acyl carrier protein